jgi:arginase
VRLRLIGVPSSAGAHAPGLEGGPAHLRVAGIGEALRCAGLDTMDSGDLPVERFDPAPAESGARNLPAVLRTVRRVAEQVARAHRERAVPVLLGGDCTLCLGAVLGLREAGYAATDVGLFYVDGDADLDTPGEGWGVLDSCGVAHLLGDGDPALAALRTDGPLIDPEGIALFGFHPAQLSPGQWRRYARHRLRGYPVTAIPAGHAGELAREALRPLAERPALVLHLDVDAIDYPSLPLADCPRYHEGLSLPDAMTAVAAAASHHGLACITLTEVNPDHDRSGEHARTLIDRWSRALAEGQNVLAARC